MTTTLKQVDIVMGCCCCCWVTSVVSDSVRPQRQQPTRRSRPWDSPGKNTGVGCHFLLQCMKVKSEREVAQLCLTLHDPMARLLHLWDFPGESTEMGCQCLLQSYGLANLKTRVTIDQKHTIDSLNQKERNSSIIQKKTIKPWKEKGKEERNKEEIQNQLENKVSNGNKYIVIVTLMSMD